MPTESPACGPGVSLLSAVVRRAAGVGEATAAVTLACGSADGVLSFLVRQSHASACECIALMVATVCCLCRAQLYGIDFLASRAGAADAALADTAPSLFGARRLARLSSTTEVLTAACARAGLGDPGDALGTVSSVGGVPLSLPPVPARRVPLGQELT